MKIRENGHGIAYTLTEIDDPAKCAQQIWVRTLNSEVVYDEKYVKDPFMEGYTQPNTRILHHWYAENQYASLEVLAHRA